MQNGSQKCHTLGQNQSHFLQKVVCSLYKLDRSRKIVKAEFHHKRQQASLCIDGSINLLQAAVQGLYIALREKRKLTQDSPILISKVSSFSILFLQIH